MQDVYYINQIDNNFVNNNKYVYVDSFDGEIKLENNKWKFDLNFYIIHNSNLPVNFFLANISTSFFNIENLQLVQINNPTIPNFVTQRDLCNVYTTSFYSEVPFDLLSNEVSLYNILLSTNLSVNTNLFETIEIKSDTHDINNFISESSLQTKTTSFEYYNTFNLENKDYAVLPLCTHIYLNSKNGAFYKNDNIVIKNKINIEEPIIDICKLTLDKPMTIKSVSTNLTYYLPDDETVYNYVNSEELWKYIDNEYTLSFNHKTLFDISTNKLQNNENGVDGIFIPVMSFGELLCKIEMLDETNNLRFVNIKRSVLFNDALDNENKINSKDETFSVDDSYNSEKYYD